MKLQSRPRRAIKAQGLRIGRATLLDAGHAPRQPAQDESVRDAVRPPARKLLLVGSGSRPAPSVGTASVHYDPRRRSGLSASSSRTTTSSRRSSAARRQAARGRVGRLRAVVFRSSTRGAPGARRCWRRLHSGGRARTGRGDHGRRAVDGEGHRGEQLTATVRPHRVDHARSPRSRRRRARSRPARRRAHQWPSAPACTARTAASTAW